MKHIFCIVLAALLSACGSPQVARKLDQHGMFPTTTQVSAENIKAAKPFKQKYKQMAYLMVDPDQDSANTKFMASILKDSGVFQTTVQIPDMERMIIEKKLTDKIDNAVGMLNLNKLQKHMGFFLVVQPFMEFKGGYNHTAHLKIQDPETGETVLHLERSAFNWNGLDDPLVYPLMNAFMQWSRGEQISVTPQK
ncbi:hypothetical protein [Massilia sp. NR 4-1]|uniref:hypothetical protein n=1 Tax=Massilia sp. NR 4-1 TaxID=1678028 RepID=UPI00067AF070|nr:hypothetical protein [Massilia sp. NR 4-1]AKU24551.1 hypothetical protein ACZ75_26870 [Massilia sp. NR 4-1]